MQELNLNQSILEDRALILQSQEGDQNAFESLVRKYRNRLLRVARRYGGLAVDEDEILQLLMCKVYFSLRSFDVNRPFYPWLRRIAINLCYDERRRQQRKALMFTELELERVDAKTERLVHAFNPYSTATRQEINDMLRAAIGMLPEQHQEIIELHHLQQMPYEELGAILKCSPRAARVKAFRARAALRRLLQESSSMPAGSSASSSIVQRLDAFCRQNLLKSSHRIQVNGAIRELSHAY